MQQPFTNSEAVRMCMVGPDAPLSSHIRYGPKPPYAVGKPRARPYSAPARRITNGNFSDPWRGPSYNEPRVAMPRSYSKVINRPTEDRQTLPSRRIESVYSRNGDIRSSMPLPPYHAMNDPHLYEYFERRFGQIQVAARRKRPHSAHSRPSSASSTAKGKKKHDDEDVLYKVAIITADKKDAGTDAKVFLTVKGLRGKIPKTRLTKKAGSVRKNSKVAFRFSKGSTHLFKIRGPEIGDLKSIIVETDGIQKEQAWFLQEVEITNVKKKKSWSFVCNNWLSLHHGDQQTTRELYPNISSKTDYEIVTVTGDKNGASTSANVYITIEGRSGVTPKIHLKDFTRTNFRQNSSDTFKIRANCVGPMKKIRIEHDNTGIGAGWYLERVVITDLNHTKWKYYFPCGMWLARDEGDGAISRYLIGSKDPFAIRKDSKYKVTVYTGNKKGAGTDANVILNIFGENGESGEQKLDNSKNNFERNSKDEFLVKCPCLGRVNRIRIGHDNTGFGPGWYLDKVIVDDCDNNIVYEFPCERWLADDEDDGALFRDLLPGVGVASSYGGVPYVITVMTGDKKNAGTSARVFIQMKGGPNKETSGKIWLDNGKFERDRSEIFNISLQALLSPVQSLEMGHDNSGVGAGWYVEQVIVYCPVTGIEQVFPCRQWLASDSEDGQIQRTLYEQKAMRQKKEKKTQWHLWVKTSDDSLSGTDARVFVCLYGTKGKTDEVELDNKSDVFEQGNTDEFDIHVSDVGKPYKLRIFHDDSSLLSGWKLDQIEMENVTTKERYLFKCGKWLAVDEDDKATVREMPAEGPLVKKPLPLVKYTVEVYTGKKSSAGTDANVFLCIFGELGDTGRRWLRDSSTNINKFEKGQCDIFEIEAVTLEKIKKVEIGHDGKGIGAGWYLEKVIIKRPDKPKFDVNIDCNSWLASDEESGHIVKEFSVSGSQLLQKTTYNVYVKTGDVSKAGTDANVHLKIFGEKGDTGILRLENAESTSNKFERNRTDHFVLHAEDIGKIKRIRIGHDGANFGSGWFLDEVRIDIPSHGQQYVFACHRWLDKSEEDGEIEIELEPSFKEEREKKIPYEVTVWTSDISKAGTDANVFIQMYGTDGKTDEIVLNNRSDNFERGMKEKFKIEQKDIGDLLKIRIGHDGKGFGAGWHLDKLLIQRRPKAGTKKRSRSAKSTKSSSALERRQSLIQQNEDQDSDSSSSSSHTPRRKRSLRKTPDLKTVVEEEDVYDGEETIDYWFYVNKWFASDEDDKQIVRELIPTDKDGKPLRKALDDVEYIVRVYTGKVTGAGTDANVFLTLFGTFKNNPLDSGERQLKTSSTNINKFESGKEDVFTIKAVELGSLTKCRIRHDNTGLVGAAWFLDRVEVEDTKNKKTYYFLCQRWLAKNKDDGQICRELVPVDKSVLKKLEREDSARMEVALETKAAMTTYHVHVITGTEFGSGTNANVFVKLYGDKDQTDKIPLKSSLTYSDKFEAGHDDEFVLEVVNIGELQKIAISHDDSGFRSDWFLDKVIIDCPSLGKSWTFPCNRWLAKGKDDGKIERELFPQDLETEEYTPCIPYEIKTYTSDKSGADTSADVYVQLFGKDMQCTQQKSLCTKQERSGKFKKGQVDVFVVELEDVGELTKLRIGHDNAGLFAGWHLDKVEVRTLNSASGKGSRRTRVAQGSKLYVFPCNRWLARDEEDKEIVRELVPEKIIKETVRKDGEVEKKEVKVKDKLQMKHYTVNVKTGDVFSAGTDANVFINIYGELGNTGERKLAKSETHMDKFERNHIDVFKLEAADLGKIYRIKIWHDNKNINPSWYLDYVEVIDTADSNKSYMFHCERWLSKSKEDCKIERSLYVKGYDGEMGSSTGTLRSTRFGGSVASLESSVDPFSKSPRVKRKQLMQEEEMDNLSRLEQIPYSVKIWTGEGEDNGTDANVWIVIYGTKKLHSGTQYLEFAQTGDKFEPGSVKTFSFDAPDVNEVKRIKLGHDGTAPGSGWFIKQVSVDMPTKGKNFLFSCGQWLARDKSDGRTERTFSLDEGMSTITSYRPKITYDCTVVTGDVDNAGTDMKIMLSASGDKGTTTPVELEKASDRFERAREDNIRLELEDVGSLKKIRVETSASGSRQSWFLERIDLFNTATGVKYRFECNQWFGKKSDDKKYWRDIPASKRGKEVISRTTYKISVKTSNVPGAGTDANVYVILFGSNGDTGELHLKKSETNKNPFENDQKDVFTFNEMLSIGEMSKCRVWHDNKGFGAAWHLEYIEAEDMTTRKKYTFHCGKWLSKKEDDKQIVRELTCATRPLTPGAEDETVYEIEVKTADKEKASTVHNGWLIIKGKKGETKMKMKNSARDKILRRGDTNSFSHSCKNLGKVQKVTVGAYEREDKPLQDLEGKDAMWYCYQVSVTDTSTGDKYLFPCKDWIQIGASPFKRSMGKELELKDVEQSQISVVRSLASIKYQVIVYTGDVFGAGTNANVYITIYGANGDSGKRVLEQSWRDLFERNQIDKFEIECLDLGEIEKVRIEHDNKNFRPAWFLDKIEIINLGTNEKKTFPCKQWLDKDKGDGAISRELLPVD
ncbi:lipoxygenase homology domain-containing protein 1-like isoform X5 [Crassostrea virginica]